jgi:hypothetical protein
VCVARTEELLEDFEQESPHGRAVGRDAGVGQERID